MTTSIPTLFNRGLNLHEDGAHMQTATDWAISSGPDDMALLLDSITSWLRDVPMTPGDPYWRKAEIARSHEARLRRALDDALDIMGETERANFDADRATAVDRSIARGQAQRAQLREEQLQLESEQAARHREILQTWSPQDVVAAAIEHNSVSSARRPLFMIPFDGGRRHLLAPEVAIVSLTRTTRSLVYYVSVDQIKDPYLVEGFPINSLAAQGTCVHGDAAKRGTRRSSGNTPMPDETSAFYVMGERKRSGTWSPRHLEPGPGMAHPFHLLPEFANYVVRHIYPHLAGLRPIDGEPIAGVRRPLDTHFWHSGRERFMDPFE